MATPKFGLFVLALYCFLAPSVVLGNIDNGYVDYVIAAMKSWIRSNSDTLAATFIDITQPFDRTPILMLPFNGTTRVWNVTVNGLKDLERTAPVITDPIDGAMTFTVQIPEVSIGTSQLTTIGPLMLPVHSYLIIKNVIGEMDLTNRTDFGLGPAFSRLAIFDIGKVSLQVTNYGFLNPVMGLVGAYAGRNQSEGFKQLMSFSIPGVMNNVINQIAVLQPPPEPYIQQANPVHHNPEIPH